MSTYRALVDLSVAKAGDTFEADDESVAPALAFGLAELVEDDLSVRSVAQMDEPKRAKRTTTSTRKKTS
jgi:hypothetical protein